MATRALLASMLLVCPYAFALNPSLDINQCAHASRTVRDGFFKGGSPDQR
jgi:hypothetical protein